MKTVRDALQVYQELSFSDRLIFYTTLSSDLDPDRNTLTEILEEARPLSSKECRYCKGSRIVRNGHRKDGTQRFLCRDCRRSFTCKTDSFVSGSHKRFGIWQKYLACMADKKTLQKSAEACGISMGTAFAWRHKILSALKASEEKFCLEGTVEADETYFNVSYKGNHTKNARFAMPRKPHKRGKSVHTKGLSFEKVCVACAVNQAGTAISKAVKTGKVSTESLDSAFGDRVLSNSILCTDHEQAYISYAGSHGLTLIQMETDRSTRGAFGIQRINAYHNKLKHFTGIFHGVSTRYLDHYLIWHDRILPTGREQKEQLQSLLALCLASGKHVRTRDLWKMPALPWDLAGSFSEAENERGEAAA